MPLDEIRLLGAHPKGVPDSGHFKTKRNKAAYQVWRNNELEASSVAEDFVEQVCHIILEFQSTNF